MRWFLIAAAVLAVGLGIGAVGAWLLDGPADSDRTGTIEFGAHGTGCRVDETASSFPSGTVSVYEAAHYAREVRAGEVVTFRVLQDGAEVASVDRTFDEAGDCLGGDLPGPLPPGRYRIEHLAGAEVLAAGESQISR
jgi:hypothetical protein